MTKYLLSRSPNHLLRRAQQYFYDYYAKSVTKNGPTPRQFVVLCAVAENEGVSQTQIVNLTGIDRSTLADMISRLKSKDYLQRERTSVDARANAVRLTAAGKAVIAACEARIVKAEEKALSILSKTQQASFLKALTSFSDALDKDKEEPSQEKSTPRKKVAKKTTTRKTVKRTTASAAPKKKTRKTTKKTTTRKSAASTKKTTARSTVATRKPDAKAVKPGRKKAAKKKVVKAVKAKAVRRPTTRPVARKSPAKKKGPARKTRKTSKS